MLTSRTVFSLKSLFPDTLATMMLSSLSNWQPGRMTETGASDERSCPASSISRRFWAFSHRDHQLYWVRHLMTNVGVWVNVGVLIFSWRNAGFNYRLLQISVSMYGRLVHHLNCTCKENKISNKRNSHCLHLNKWTCKQLLCYIKMLNFNSIWTAAFTLLKDANFTTHIAFTYYHFFLSEFFQKNAGML